MIDSELAGVYSFQIMLEGPPESLKRPECWRGSIGCKSELRRVPYVRKVTSVADYVKRIQQASCMMAGLTPA